MTGPGAQIDLLTRALADRMKDILGQPVLVSNKPGGSHGSVMASELASAPKDGYTLGVSATAAFTYSPHVVRTTYKLDDFDYISLLGLNQSGIIWPCRARGKRLCGWPFMRPSRATPLLRWCLFL